MWDINWDDFVRGASMRYGGMQQTPEGIMESYHDTNKSLTTVRERLKNPVSLKGGGPLQPSSIRQLERQEKELIQSADAYHKVIKRLVKYNLLPTSKLISGADRKMFVFSLQTMLELPEFGKAVYYANRLLGCRYDNIIPSTNDGYVQCLKSPGRLQNKQEEQSRESMYDALINSLNETIERIKKDRQRLLFSGEPWRPAKNDSEITDNKTGNLERLRQQEKQLQDLKKNEGKKIRVIRGGLYKPPEVSTNKADTIISDEFKAWRHGQAKTDHHTNA